MLRGAFIAATIAACAESERLPIADESGRVPDLGCPGSPGCRDVRGPLRAGVALLPITPRVETWSDLDGDGTRDQNEPFDDVDGDGVWDPVWMAGFSTGRAATGIHDDNWTRVLTLSQGDLRIAIVALDLIGYFHDDVVAMRQAIADAGHDFDHVMVVSTHQHEGPDTMGPWGASPFSRGVDPEYMRRLIDDSVRAVGIAVQSERECSLAAGQRDTTDLIHDSRLPRVIDPSVTAIAFRSKGSVFATLSIWGNHPETLDGDNTQITSDYPHALRDRLEAEFPGSIAVFVPGTLGGLMNPLHVTGCPDASGQPTCGDGTFEKARYIGEGVADAAIEALRDPSHVEEQPRLAIRRHAFFVGSQNLAFITAFVGGILERTIYDREHETIPPHVAMALSLEDALAGAVQLQTEVNALSLGPIEIVTVPGELYPELWLMGPMGERYLEQPEGADEPNAELELPIQGMLPDAGIKAIINQANDALGYIIPRTQFDLSAPHAYEADGQYGESNSLGPETSTELLRAIDELY